jgi:hypothetical protein
MSRLQYRVLLIATLFGAFVLGFIVAEQRHKKYNHIIQNWHVAPSDLSWPDLVDRAPGQFHVAAPSVKNVRGRVLAVEDNGEVTVLADFAIPATLPTIVFQGKPTPEAIAMDAKEAARRAEALKEGSK